MSINAQGQEASSSKRGVDYIGVGVGALIVDGEGRLFLARRGPLAKNERNLWEFPGGAVEFGEPLAAALRREMSEEYGIEIEVGELLDVVDHILPGEGQHWVSPTFLCRILHGEPAIREPGKCSATGWFAPEDVPEELTQITRANLAHYRAILGRARGRMSDPPAGEMTARAAAGDES
jgi:mutator protein MutT